MAQPKNKRWSYSSFIQLLKNICRYVIYCIYHSDIVLHHEFFIVSYILKSGYYRSLILSRIGSTLMFRLVSGQITVTVIPSENLVGKVIGLLGKFDNDPSNDLLPKTGSALPLNSPSSTIFNIFGSSCKYNFVWKHKNCGKKINL